MVTISIRGWRGDKAAQWGEGLGVDYLAVATCARARRLSCYVQRTWLDPSDAGVMTRMVVSAEDGEELKRLYEQLALATFRASIALGKEGTESPKFKEADKAAGKAWRRIRMILGDSSTYWM